MPIFTEAMIKDHALYKEGKEDGIEEGRKKEQALKAAAEKKEQALKAVAEKKEVQAIINLHADGVDIKITDYNGLPPF